MDKLIEYQIPYKGLSIGKHEYYFHAKDKFFADMQVETIEGGDLKISLELDRQSRLMQADMKIIGTLKLVCDRCIDEFDFKIDIDHSQIYKYGNAPEKHNDDIKYLGEGSYKLDVSELIMENVLLQIPIRKIHPDDANGNSTCKAEQLHLIENYGKRELSDPRWEALKSIKFDD